MSVIQYKMAESLARAIVDNPDKWSPELVKSAKWFFSLGGEYWLLPANVHRHNRDHKPWIEIKANLPDNYVDIWRSCTENIQENK